MSLSSRAVAVAATTGCPRLASAARHGWSDTAVARANGEVAIEPRLAFALGQHFERQATGDDQALLELLGATGNVVRFADDEPADQFNAFQRALADPQVVLIAQGVLPGLYGSWHRPDVMIRRGDRWRIGEVKVYLDRGGDTPPAMVQSAITQSAVSIVAASRMGLTVDDQIVLILADMRGKPTTRTVSAAGERALIEQLLDRAPLQTVSQTEPPLAQHVYSADCEGRCALATICRAEAAREPGTLWPALPTDLGVTHLDLLEAAKAGAAPAAVQAGWDAAATRWP